MLVEYFILMFLSSSVLSSNPNTTQSRIIGGQETQIEKYPFIVYYFGSVACGGSIIAPSWIITATHCAKPLSMDTVLYGHANKDDAVSGQDIARVKQKFHLRLPEGPNSIFDEYIDVSLLELEAPIPLDKAAVVKLPPPNFEIPGDYQEDLIVIGWGLMEENVPVVAKILRHTVIKAVSNKECEISGGQFNDKGKVPSWILCGGTQGGGRAACSGDSGGPAITADGTLVGIVSFGLKCGSPGLSGAYMKVSHFIDQIEKTTGLRRDQGGFLK